jgi:hypothetical protein
MRICSVVVLALGLAFPASFAADDASSALDGMKVLVVSPAAEEGHGGWIRDLLAKHGAKAVLASWEQAGAERAREFDLVVVTGPERAVSGVKVVRGYDRPVLGIGPYAYVWFGGSGLKHGAPFS